MSKLSQARFDELVKTYCEYRAFDGAHSPANVRAALIRIAAMMQDAAQCISEMSAGGMDITDETPVRAAWRQVNLVLHAQPDRPLIAGNAVAGMLAGWAHAATSARDLVPATRFTRSAFHMLADKLYAFRTHEQLPCASTISGPAVAELRAIAKAAGDNSITKESARTAFKAAIQRGREQRPKAAE
jgi:hypothetical protein